MPDQMNIGGLFQKPQISVLGQSFTPADPGMDYQRGVMQRQVLEQAQAQHEAQQMAMQQAQDFERQRQGELAKFRANENPTARDILNLSMFMDKDQASNLRSGFEGMAKEKQEANLRFGGQVMSAFESGRHEVASNLLARQAEAARNGGDEQGAQFYETMAQQVKDNPKNAKTSLGIMLAHLPGGDKVLEGIGRAGDEQRKAELQPFSLQQANQNIAKTAAEIGMTRAQTSKFMAETRKIGIEAKKLALETQSGAINGGKPLPPSSMRQVAEGLDAIGTASGMKADISSLLGQIQEGNLSFGVVENLKNKALNATGNSTDKSKNYGSFMASMNKIRNDWLSLQKGTQTEGDAKRAWDALFTSFTDTELIKQRLEELAISSDRDVIRHKNVVDDIRSNHNLPAMDYSRYDMPAIVGANKNINPTSNSNFTPPAIGTVENGHRYIGGDPANPKSWSKL